MSSTNIRQAVVLVFIQSYGIMAIQFVAIMVLSRLLAPAEVGVYSIGAIIFGIVSYARDFGVGAYITRTEHLDDALIRNAIGLNTITTCLASLLLLLSAPIAAHYYQIDGIASVLVVFAVICLIIGPGTVPMAYHRRQMNVVPQFWTAFIQTLTSVTVSVVLAWLGFSYMALAYGQLAAMAAATAASLLFRPKEFPIRPVFQNMAAISRFGSGIVWMNVLDRFGKGLPELVIARTAGIQASALYSRGNGLIDIFRNTLEKIASSVSMPFYAQQHREGLSLRMATRRTLDISLALGWPFAIVLGMFSKTVLLILFGELWVAAAEYLRILCVLLAAELLAYPTKDLLVACGHVGQAARLQTIIHAVRIALVAATVSFGALAICWALVVASFIGAGLAYFSLSRVIGLNLKDVWLGMRDPLWISLAIAVVAWGSAYMTSAWPEWASFAVAVVSVFVSWLAFLRFINHLLWNEIARLPRGLIDSLAKRRQR